jgi:hypothetical protein
LSLSDIKTIDTINLELVGEKSWIAKAEREKALAEKSKGECDKIEIANKSTQGYKVVMIKYR